MRQGTSPFYMEYPQCSAASCRIDRRAPGEEMAPVDVSDEARSMRHAPSIMRDAPRDHARAWSRRRSCARMRSTIGPPRWRHRALCPILSGLPPHCPLPAALRRMPPAHYAASWLVAPAPIKLSHVAGEVAAARDRRDWAVPPSDDPAAARSAERHSDARPSSLAGGLRTPPALVGYP